MEKIFDVSKFDSYKEDNRREVKRANGGLPIALWETYSSFANTYGGVIILGIKESDDKSWKTTGLKKADKEKLLDNFWNLIHNSQKVNINLLAENDVETYEVREDLIIVIHVPMAKREQKPIFINNDMFGGTFRRDHTGDYHCTRLQVKAMLRDQTDNTMDMEMLDPTIRWTDRLQSSSGEWSGNIFDFYFRVYNKIVKEIKVPFKIKGYYSRPI